MAKSAGRSAVTTAAIDMQIPIVYLAIVGSQTLVDPSIENLISGFITNHPNYPGIVIVSGGAIGPDSIAVAIAKELRLDYEEYLPDWKRFGIAAGMIRNTLIIDRATEVLAIWDGSSPGTKDSITKTKLLKKPLTVIKRRPSLTSIFD